MSYGSILYNVRLLLYAIFLVILTVIGIEIDERIAEIKCEFCGESLAIDNSTGQALRAAQNRELVKLSLLYHASYNAFLL